MGSLWEDQSLSILQFFMPINFIGTIAILKCLVKIKTRKTKMDTLINLISFIFILLDQLLF